MTTKGEKRKHWLDFASDKFDKQLIEDIKRVLSVLVLFLPIPFFWTLFDQQVNGVTLFKLFLEFLEVKFLHFSGIALDFPSDAHGRLFGRTFRH